MSIHKGDIRYHKDNINYNVIYPTKKDAVRTSVWRPRTLKPSAADVREASAADGFRSVDGFYEKASVLRPHRRTAIISRPFADAACHIWRFCYIAHDLMLTIITSEKASYHKHSIVGAFRIAF